MNYLILALYISILIVSDNSGTSLENVQLSQCGINSLYLCLKYHDIKVNLDQMYSDINPDADNNVSLKQLADYAKRNRLYVKPIIKPSIEDFKKYLSKDNSIILQYSLNLPNNNQFKHIVGFVMRDNKIFLLDYPKAAYKIEIEELAQGIKASEGILVLSKQPVWALSELFNFKSLESWSFISVCLGIITVVVVIFAHFIKKAKKI